MPCICALVAACTFGLMSAMHMAIPARLYTQACFVPEPSLYANNATSRRALPMEFSDIGRAGIIWGAGLESSF
jgi:hypothetical protein